MLVISEIMELFRNCKACSDLIKLFVFAIVEFVENLRSADDISKLVFLYAIIIINDT